MTDKTNRNQRSSHIGIKMYFNSETDNKYLIQNDAISDYNIDNKWYKFKLQSLAFAYVFIICYVFIISYIYCN